jgi:hypothetical protein
MIAGNKENKRYLAERETKYLATEYHTLVAS